jgi:hypothetical protein
VDNCNVSELSKETEALTVNASLGDQPLDGSCDNVTLSKV